MVRWSVGTCDVAWSSNTPAMHCRFRLPRQRRPPDQGRYYNGRNSANLFGDRIMDLRKMLKTVLSIAVVPTELAAYEFRLIAFLKMRQDLSEMVSDLSAVDQSGGCGCIGHSPITTMDTG